MVSRSSNGNSTGNMLTKEARTVQSSKPTLPTILIRTHSLMATRTMATNKPTEKRAMKVGPLLSDGLPLYGSGVDMLAAVEEDDRCCGGVKIGERRLCWLKEWRPFQLRQRLLVLSVLRTADDCRTCTRPSNSCS